MEILCSDKELFHQLLSGSRDSSGATRMHSSVQLLCNNGNQHRVLETQVVRNDYSLVDTHTIIQKTNSLSPLLPKKKEPKSKKNTLSFRDSSGATNILC